MITRVFQRFATGDPPGTLRWAVFCWELFGGKMSCKKREIVRLGAVFSEAIVGLRRHYTLKEWNMDPVAPESVTPDPNHIQAKVHLTQVTVRGGEQEHQRCVPTNADFVQ
jgi:hypothetical protein